jgi:hypothetical protein
MRSQSLDIVEAAVLHAHDIAIAHQYHLLAIDADHPMNHVSATVNPCEHHVTHVYL